MFYTYIHYRKDTLNPFYIGKGKGKRVCRIDSRNDYWNRVVEKAGGFYFGFLAQNLDEELAFLCELEAIDVYRKRGYKLTNMTDGGEGTTGSKRSEENKRKLAEANRKRKGIKKGPCSEERKKNISKALKGRKFSKEWKENISKAKKGTVVSDEQKRKVSEKLKGRVFSEEHRKNLVLNHWRKKKIESN